MVYVFAICATISLMFAVFQTRGRRRDQRLALEQAQAVHETVERAVTARTRALEEELTRSMQLAAVGQLVAGVGHEINNPLAYVVTNIELVAEQWDETSDPEVVASLADAKDGVERIRQIVRDLQVFSRTDDGEQMVDINQVLRRCIRMANTQIRHAARLVVELGTVPAVSANETRLGQVFLNLLVNAAQAIGEGSCDQNQIAVRSFTDNGRAVIEIRDSGPGIPADIRAKIFDPFFTTKPVGSGTGLGLSICRSIVLAMKGEIEVVSELGQGSVFRVTLPQPKVRRERKASFPLLPSQLRKRVLVVDDEPLICRSVQKSLAVEHDVVAEVSARNALEQIRAGERFDVILCDLMMPELSGIDLYEAVRVSAPEMVSRIVFMTGGVLNDRTRGFLVGMPNALLEKPLSSKSLRKAVGESAFTHVRAPEHASGGGSPTM